MTLDSESMSFNRNKDDMTGAIAAAAETGESEFYSWFNKSGTVEQSFLRGAWDFVFYFASKEVCRYICQPEEKICLEIGYGGGRLLNASRSFFKWSHGIDVHPFAAKVSDLLLKLRPEKDFTLHTLDTPDVPIEDDSIDYIYSFIAIQHFYSKDIFIRYLEEAKRLLVRGGLSIYFLRIWGNIINNIRAMFLLEAFTAYWKSQSRQISELHTIHSGCRDDMFQEG